MKVRFFGVRGSIPAPGPSTMRYGGNTVCVQVILSDGTMLVLDAGTGMRELGKVLLAGGGVPDPLHVLLTHVHWDHIIGFPFFAPLYRPETRVQLYPLPNSAQEHQYHRKVLFDGIHFPIRAEDIPARIDALVDPSPVWRIGSAEVRRIALNHPGGAQGFRIDDTDGKSLAYITDNELNPPGHVNTSARTLATFARHVDVLIHDSQYVPADLPMKRGWGHSTIDDVLQLAADAETPNVVLFHHEPERDDDALDAIGLSASAWLDAHAKGTKVTVASEGLILDI